MEIGLVQRINIDDEMQQAYLDYAMSVIVARALPDARDGLKPVHRRILYAMHDMGIRPDSAYKKSARIVGEVLGKYHPHGDMAVYDAMARMAQDFSMRYTLIDGQGNFGSVDGDAPAAMRYTEARLAAPAAEILADIQKNTVDFDENFDGTLTEPQVLPSALPNMLVNGATGIAVGMATSIPPHNLGEVVEAIHYMLENWEKLDDLTVEDLMTFVQGPDFPTGGIIVQEEESDGLVSAYSTGRGRVTVRASARLEEMERGRNRIIITELPFMTNKSSLIERIANLVREERLEGIADLRDESDRQGMRIVIELTKTTDPQATLSNLYKSTPMQSTFSIIMLALVDGEPRLLSLKQSLRVFIEHRLEIVRRRSEYDLERARQRSHILEGLLVALRNLDEIITLIRRSPDVETARERLIKRFKLTVIQAQAILDMPLRRLAALERKKIEEEFKEIQALIKDLEALLRSPKKMRQVVDQELEKIKDIYADRRRTHIARLKAGDSKVSLLTATDLKPEKQVWISVSPEGLIGRSLDDNQPRLSGKEAPIFLYQANTHDTLYLVNSQGEAAALPVHALPETESPLEGLPLHRVSPMSDNDTLTALFTRPPKKQQADGAEEGYVLTVTRQGMVKKSALVDLPGPSAATFTLVKVNPDDRLGWLRLTNGKDELILITALGMAIRFSEEEVRPMGLVAAGVMGIKLQEKDEVVGAEVLASRGEVFLLANDGSAKRVPFDQFSRQGRYGLGLIAWKLSPNIKIIGSATGKGTTRLIVHLTRLVPKAIRLDEAPIMSRTARGQKILDLKSGDEITALCLPQESEKASSTKAQPPGAKSPAKRTTRSTSRSTTKSTSARAKSTPASKTTSSSKTSTRTSGKSTSSTSSRTKTSTRSSTRTSKSSTSSSPSGTTGSKGSANTAGTTPSTARKKTSTSSTNSSGSPTAKPTSTQTRKTSSQTAASKKTAGGASASRKKTPASTTKKPASPGKSQASGASKTTSPNPSTKKTTAESAPKRSTSTTRKPPSKPNVESDPKEEPPKKPPAKKAGAA